IQDLSPAEIEAFKRYCKEHYDEDPIERAKGLDYYGKHLELVLEREPYSAVSRIPEDQRAQLRADAEKLRRAEGNEKAYFEALEHKTPAQRAAIMEYYREVSGGDKLERRIQSYLDGADRERALNFLRIGSDCESANIHETLTDHNAAHAIERISTLPPDKLVEAEKDFQERYGTSLRDAIKNDDKL